jgi:hypothetical protein
MEALYEGIAGALPWFAIALIFIGIGYFQHVEKLRKLDNFHRERLAALEKGLPPPEIPTEPPKLVPPPAKPMPNAALLTGIITSAVSLGAMAVLFVTLPEPAHNFWILPLPVLLVGFGLMLFHFLKNDAFNRFD